jgi:hypothetical protein
MVRPQTNIPQFSQRVHSEFQIMCFPSFNSLGQAACSHFENFLLNPKQFSRTLEKACSFFATGVGPVYDDIFSVESSYVLVALGPKTCYLFLFAVMICWFLFSMADIGLGLPVFLNIPSQALNLGTHHFSNRNHKKTLMIITRFISFMANGILHCGAPLSQNRISGQLSDAFPVFLEPLVALASHFLSIISWFSLICLSSRQSFSCKKA